MKIDTSNTLDLRRFFREIKKSWWAYLASIILFGGLAITYYKVRMPAYDSHAFVMIEDSGSGGLGNALGSMAGVTRMFSIGGLGGSSASNEIMIMNSHEVIMASVKELELNRIYIEHDNGNRYLLYGDSPVELKVPEEFFDTLSKGFRLQVELNGAKANITLQRGNRFFPKTVGTYPNQTLPTVLNTPYGPLTLELTAEGRNGAGQRDITINVLSNEGAVEAIQEKLSIDLIDKMGNGIYYTFEDPSKERGRAIINNLIAQYEAKRLNRSHEAASEQVEFYDGRIADLFAQLSQQEQDIENYKKNNNLTAVEAEAELLAKSRVENQTAIAQMQAQLTFYQQVLSTLENDPDGMAVIATGSSQVAANPLIDQYNTAVIEKRKLEMSAKPDNVALVQQKELIAGMRKSLLQNAQLMVEEAQIGLRSLYALDDKAGSRLNQMPEHERKYVKMLRDQTVLSELYLYLIGERESAAMDVYSTTTPSFVVDAAYSDIKPSLTKVIVICALCFILALCIPTAFALWQMKRKDRMSEPFDLAAMNLEEHTVVFTGEASQLAEMRRMLTANPEAKEILVADFTDGDVLGRLANSFVRAGVDAGVYTLGDLSLSADNDSLANPLLETNLEAKMQDNEEKYAFVIIPDNKRLSELSGKLKSGKSSLLVITKRNSMKVSAFRKILSGNPAEEVYIMLA